MSGSLSRKEFFAGVILSVTFTSLAVASVYGFTLPYFSIELRRGLYCFSGNTKNIFLISLILFAPAINTIIYLGLKVRSGLTVSFIENKLLSALLLGLFFASAIGIFGSLIVAGRQCA